MVVSFSRNVDVTGWLRYPGNLAHHVSGHAQGVDGRRNHDEFRGPITTIGVRVQTSCGRELNVWFPDAGGRAPSAERVDPLELRAERPRGFCLRCAYWAALDALVLSDRSLGRFADAIESGALPSIDVAA